MKVYLLDSEQVEELSALNTHAATFVPCDHGKGASVGVTDFDPAEFAAHKKMLVGWDLKVTEMVSPEEL